MMYLQKLHIPSNYYIKQNAIKQSISTAFKHWPAPPAVGLQKKQKNVPKERNKIEKICLPLFLKMTINRKMEKLGNDLLFGEILE